MSSRWVEGATSNILGFLGGYATGVAPTRKTPQQGVGCCQARIGSASPCPGLVQIVQEQAI